MSSAHAVLPCHAGDSEEGEHFNLHFWIHEAMDGAVTASTTTKYFIWSRAARQLSTICKTVIKCKTTIKCCQWRRFEEGFSKIFLPLRTGAAFCDNKMESQSVCLLLSAALAQLLTKTKLLEPHYLVTRFPLLVLVTREAANIVWYRHSALRLAGGGALRYLNPHMQVIYIRPALCCAGIRNIQHFVFTHFYR